MAKFSDLLAAKVARAAAKGIPGGSAAHAATATAITSRGKFLRCRFAHGRGKRSATQSSERHRAQDRRTRRTQGRLREDRRAVQLDVARARTGKIPDAGPVRHAQGGRAPPTTRCAPNSTRSKEGDRAGDRGPKSCARISNCRANPTAAWRAPDRAVQRLSARDARSAELERQLRRRPPSAAR